MNARVRFCAMVASMVTVIAATAAAPSSQFSLKVVSDAPLPAGVSGFDVRWESDTEFVIAAGILGVRRMNARGLTGPLEGRPAARADFASLLGTGAGYLAFGTPFGALTAARSDLTDARVAAQSFAAIVDLDAREDRVAVLGAMRGEQLGLASDGAIAWTGSLSKGLRDLRPLMRGRSKPGAKDVARCGILGIGAIRVLRDGSIVVFPGAEPGFYHYDARGNLLRTWQTDTLGIFDDCSMSDKEVALLARDFVHRTKWLSSRTTVEDILPLEAGPALLLRSVSGGATRWDLAIFSGSAAPRRVSLPISFPTPRGHARGDVRGNRIALVLADAPLPGQKPASPSRLVTLTIQ